MELAVDQEGYLTNLSDWSEDAAFTLAAGQGIELNNLHWEVIDTLRQFYAETQVAPAMRPLVKLIKQAHGEDKGNSIYLMQLFGSSPAKTAALIAGLPRPANCL